MPNLIETDVPHIKYKDTDNKEHSYAVVAVVTVPDEIIEKNEGKEKKLEKIWERFYKNGYKELEVIEDIRLADDKNDALNGYEDDQYLFVNYESLSALTERKRNNYSVGLRYAEENEDLTYIAKSFSDEFVEDIDIDEVETLDKDIPFAYIEESQEKAIRKIKSLSRENERRLSQEESDENRIGKRKESVSSEEATENIEETDSNHNEESNIEEMPKESENEAEEVEEVEPENDEEEYEYEEEYEEESEIERLQNELYNTINNLMPEVYLDNFDLDLEFKNQEEEYSTYSELENLTLNNVKKARTRTIERLKEERQSIVDRLYRQTSSSLYKKFTDAERLFNYESPESEYNNEYLNIKGMYDEVKDNIDAQREEKFAELTRKFEEYKERMARHAYEETKARIEQEERINVEKEADEYREDIIAETEQI